MQQVPNFRTSACSICSNLLYVFCVLFYCVNATVQKRNPISKAPNGIYFSILCLQCTWSWHIPPYIKDKQLESCSRHGACSHQAHQEVWKKGQLGAYTKGKAITQKRGSLVIPLRAQTRSPKALLFSKMTAKDEN